MSKFLASFIAIAFSAGLTAAHAQNVDSDKAKAQGEEKTMKDKEAGAKGTGKPDQTQANKKAGQSNNGQAAGSPTIRARIPARPIRTARNLNSSRDSAVCAILLAHTDSEVTDGLVCERHEPVVSLRTVALLTRRLVRAARARIATSGVFSLRLTHCIYARATVSSEMKAGAADTFTLQPSDIIPLPLTG